MECFFCDVPISVLLQWCSSCYNMFYCENFMTTDVTETWLCYFYRASACRELYCFINSVRLSGCLSG